jgi:uncharacterized protein with NRDE domain
MLRWESDIKMDFRKTGHEVTNWIELDQVGSLVTRVNFWVPFQQGISTIHSRGIIYDQVLILSHTNTHRHINTVDV